MYGGGHTLGPSFFSESPGRVSLDGDFGQHIGCQVQKHLAELDSAHLALNGSIPVLHGDKADDFNFH